MTPEPSSGPDGRSRARAQPRVQDLKDPALYVSRELSQLEFNRRVLAQVQDPKTPLLERLRFLSICSTNLDEFFEIRVAGLKQQASYGLPQRGADGLSAPETLERISEVAHSLVAAQYGTLNDELLPALADEGIRILRRGQWSRRQRQWVKTHFARQVLPVLTPIGLDPAHPFPKVLNKSLCFIVSLSGRDAFGRSSGFAVVQAPRSLPRLVALPAGVREAPYDFVLLSSIIHAHVEALFPGMKVTGCFQFRLTRNSDLYVDEEEVDDLLHALEGELRQRGFGHAVRLEVANNCPRELSEFLLEQFELTPRDLYEVNGPVNLYRLAALYEQVDRPELKFPAFIPGTPTRLTQGEGVFDVLQKGDILLHHPYQSFSPVVELVRSAAADPAVLAVKQTLYRTGAKSPFVDALIDAARAGKEVTAVVELRARFDEAANIDLATRLQEAGVNVVYGIVGYKAHGKMTLIVRREGKSLRRYVHLGTGNYHTGTTRAYTDLSLLTCDKETGEDAHNLFQQLTGLGKVIRPKQLLQAPFVLKKHFLQLIAQEAAEAEAGRPARIMGKMNALSDAEIIRALYQASQAGVRIDLCVRGICCLRPGVPGLSENIRVRSIVGRFLEHTRLFYFWARGEGRTFAASADWMERNFHRRFEIAFPINDADLRARAVREVLENYFTDNTNAWVLGPDGTYTRAKKGSAKPKNAQEALLVQLAE